MFLVIFVVVLLLFAVFFLAGIIQQGNISVACRQQGYEFGQLDGNVFCCYSIIDANTYLGKFFQKQCFNKESEIVRENYE